MSLDIVAVNAIPHWWGTTLIGCNLRPLSRAKDRTKPSEPHPPGITCEYCVLCFIFCFSSWIPEMFFSSPLDFRAVNLKIVHY